MKIKIIRPVPTNPAPVIGEVYEVVEVVRGGANGTVYFVECEKNKTGVLEQEMTIVEN